MHRDLKLENIFVNKNGENETLVIGDLGFAKKFKSGNMTAKSVIGTFEYVAPEIMNKKKDETYDNKADLWSIGVIFYKLLYDRDPFDKKNLDDRLVMQKRMSGENLIFPTDVTVSSDSKNLLKRLLVYDPNYRITTKSVMGMGWYDNLEKDVLDYFKKISSNICSIPTSLPLTGQKSDVSSLLDAHDEHEKKFHLNVHKVSGFSGTDPLTSFLLGSGSDMADSNMIPATFCLSKNQSFQPALSKKDFDVNMKEAKSTSDLGPVLGLQMADSNTKVPIEKENNKIPKSQKNSSGHIDFGMENLPYHKILTNDFPDDNVILEERQDKSEIQEDKDCKNKFLVRIFSGYGGEDDEGFADSFVL